jgi:hypothetical protein
MLALTMGIQECVDGQGRQVRVVSDSSVRRLLTDVGTQLPYDEMRVVEEKALVRIFAA